MSWKPRTKFARTLVASFLAEVGSDPATEAFITQAAQDAEDALYQERRLHEAAVGEVGQVVKVANVVALELEARAAAFAQRLQRVDADAVVDLDRSPVDETQWFTTRIIVRDQRITIQVNGVTTVVE